MNKTERLRPVVGLIPLWDNEKESLWMLPGYMDGIREAGGIPLMLPLTENEEELRQLVRLVDGILFTGGHDVSPEMYGEQPLNDGVICCHRRDDMERIVLRMAMEEHKAVLGICRGIQFINAALGGNLYQDLQIQYSTKTEHHQTPPYDKPVHKVKLAEGTPLQQLLKVEELSVNSYHHQAVRTLAPGLSIMAISEDGLIEGVYKEDESFFWAIQWHPEFSYRTDANSKKIFEAFIAVMN